MRVHVLPYATAGPRLLVLVAVASLACAETSKSNAFGSFVLVKSNNERRLSASGSPRSPFTCLLPVSSGLSRPTYVRGTLCLHVNASEKPVMLRNTIHPALLLINAPGSRPGQPPRLHTEALRGRGSRGAPTGLHVRAVVGLWPFASGQRRLRGPFLPSTCGERC
ncbi:hypothetical protein CDD83_3345 [Cordyceps sp. RAO-2017]|nr:hypothetical protein CDD83_3345 [Cordyceps sp. RAO-2017]